MPDTAPDSAELTVVEAHLLSGAPLGKTLINAAENLVVQHAEWLEENDPEFTARLLLTLQNSDFDYLRLRFGRPANVRQIVRAMVGAAVQNRPERLDGIGHGVHSSVTENSYTIATLVTATAALPQETALTLLSGIGGHLLSQLLPQPVLKDFHAPRPLRTLLERRTTLHAKYWSQGLLPEVHACDEVVLAGVSNFCTDAGTELSEDGREEWRAWTEVLSLCRPKTIALAFSHVRFHPGELKQWCLRVEELKPVEVETILASCPGLPTGNFNLTSRSAARAAIVHRTPARAQVFRKKNFAALHPANAELPETEAFALAWELRDYEGLAMRDLDAAGTLRLACQLSRQIRRDNADTTVRNVPQEITLALQDPAVRSGALLELARLRGTVMLRTVIHSFGKLNLTPTPAELLLMSAVQTSDQDSSEGTLPRWICEQTNWAALTTLLFPELPQTAETGA